MYTNPKHLNHKHHIKIKEGNPTKKTIAILIILLLTIQTIGITTATTNQTYDYVIITTNEIESESNKLDDFIQHKENLGYSVYTATEDDYEQMTGPPPNGRAEKIRQWLIENYIEMGIKYVLLIGNPDPDHPLKPTDTIGDIPMKMCMSGWQLDSPIWTLLVQLLKPEYPTDYYYADLTGDWDYDDDKIYGEHLDDIYWAEGKGVDFIPEVYVGRIPVYNKDYQSLDQIFQKTINYENTKEDIAYRKNALLAMGYVKTFYDHASLGEQIVNDILIPHNFDYWRMYQQGSFLSFLDSKYESDEELIGPAFKNKWIGNPYGIVCWAAHGRATYSYLGTSFFTEGYLININDCQYLDDNHPAFTFQISCLNGEPEVQNNLGYSLLKHGAIATVSGSRETLMGFEELEEFIGSYSSGGIAYDYVKYLVDGYSASESLYLGKMSPIPEEPGDMGNLRNILCYNLYGDPSLRLLN